MTDPTALELRRLAQRVLTERQLEAFDLVLVAEFAVWETAWRMGITEPAVNGLLARGIRRLQEYVEGGEQALSALAAGRARTRARSDGDEGGRGIRGLGRNRVAA